VGGALPLDDSPDEGARLGSRDDCPVLPCLPYTALNADRIDPDRSPAPVAGDAGQSPRLAAALVVISAAQLMVVLDATIITVALPSIQRALHFSPANLEWVISGYTLAFGGLLLLGGRLGDVLGRRRMFVLGLAVFSLGSLAGGLATTSAWLIASRAVQGVGGAIAAPTALALIGDTFPEGPSRTRAMGVYAAMSGAGGALGLLLGGILTDIASWRWVLFVNVPIGAVVAGAAPRVLGKSAPRGDQLDVPGAFAATAGTTALVYGLVRAPVQGWADAITVSAFAAAALLLLAFVTIEVRSDHPILPFRLLASRNRAATYLVMAAIAGSIFAVSFFLTLLMQTAFRYSPLRTGAAFLPFSVGIVATSEVVAKLIGRVQPRVFATAGPLVAAFALLWLSRVHATSTYFGSVVGPLLLLSVGLGLSFVPLTLGATSGVPPADMGVASALLNTSQEVGGTLGLAVLVTVATATTRHALRSGAARHLLGQPARTLALNSTVHGYSTAFLVGSYISFAAFLIALAGFRLPRPPAAPSAPPATSRKPEPHTGHPDTEPSTSGHPVNGSSEHRTDAP
jgi:EmrB/QacA subfamily drug resistance transporter